MDDNRTLLNQPLQVINLGLKTFAEDLSRQGVEVVDVDWSPPGGGDARLVEALGNLLDHEDEIEEANRKTLQRMFEVEPRWVDVLPAREALSELGERELLHAGPPIEWDRVCGPQRRGVLGACVLEGWADDFEQAKTLLERGEVEITPSYRHGVVVPMATVASPSMPLLVVEDADSGSRAYSTLNEGRGEVQWFGVMNRDVLDHLRWIRSELGPALQGAARALDEAPNVFDVVAQGLLMGDECHVRAGATTGELLKRITPGLLASDLDREGIREVYQFVADNTLFSLNFTMAACKVAAERAHGVPGSSVLTAITRNGEDFAVRVGGRDEWVVGSAPKMADAIYYSGYSVEDSAGDIGDSSILEVVGLGGMAIAAAPTVVDFVGGQIDDQLRKTSELRDLTLESHPDFKIPNLNQAGSPVGVDVRRVVETGRTPFIDSGVIHEGDWETGQIGAGVAQAPLEPFQEALLKLAEEYPSPR